MSLTYFAYYEDASMVEAAAKTRGFTGNDGESWHDFIEADDEGFRTSRQFSDLKEAENWLKEEIGALNKSVYGCGSIIAQQPAPKRCRYCTCRGIHDVRKWTIDDIGIVDEEELDSPCLDE